MGRHKRIPTRNRKKLKSVDPFNKNAAISRAEAKSKINWEPKDDNQEMTRSWMELQCRLINSVSKEESNARIKCLLKQKEMVSGKVVSKTVQNFIRRVERMTHKAIKDHEILIKQGLVGREEAEIASDFKLLEEKEKRRKEQDKNKIQNKIKAAREQREHDAKIKEEKLKDKMEKKLKQREMKRHANEMESEGKIETMSEVNERGRSHRLPRRRRARRRSLLRVGVKGLNYFVN
ncbi:hypothetical protein KIN20_032888 [Parelaphostrongylus tenuis]|uniref:Uncharacterized protein n=1 Tax=Parelaphostrongylus tenuis TaxID=148309 RepID=A0AAD5R747_PARTN|nr:hypothetical protein KIN20_032888 [Parelaphostrongylus tenuis]